MYKDKSICVVVPAYNEATQISKVIQTMPEYVDKIVVIDDASVDQTVDIVRAEMKKSEKVHLITHPTNQWVGGAIATSYKWARDNEKDSAITRRN